MSKTKIVCVLGPASSSKNVIQEMVRAGMDVVRLDFLHGKQSDYISLFHEIRSISEEFDNQLSIMCDIQGPRINTGIMYEQFLLVAGDKIDVTNLEVIGTPECIHIEYDSIVSDLDTGDIIYINDGLVKLVVEGKSQHYLHCVVEAGGVISNHKGCNFPKGNLSVEFVTQKDLSDLELIAKLSPEFLSASFIESRAHVQRIRKILRDFGNTDDIKIFAKIETSRALENIDEIIEEADGIMVARGDLGVEIDAWEVPRRQKEICRKCNAAGKPVIVATQMLESMITTPRPTRAEASDVFNAVLDGTDAVMLSGETSIGNYPVEAILIMDSIVSTAEKHLAPRSSEEFYSRRIGMTETIAVGTTRMCSMISLQFKWNTKIIVVTGPPNAYVARMVSKYRPPVEIMALTDDKRTALELNIVWGIRSVWHATLKDYDDEHRNSEAVKIALEKKFLQETDHVIIVSHSRFGSGAICCIYYVKEVLERCLVN